MCIPLNAGVDVNATENVQTTMATVATRANLAIVQMLRKRDADVNCLLEEKLWQARSNTCKSRLRKR